MWVLVWLLAFRNWGILDLGFQGNSSACQMADGMGAVVFGDILDFRILGSILAC